MVQQMADTILTLKISMVKYYLVSTNKFILIKYKQIELQRELSLRSPICLQ